MNDVKAFSALVQKRTEGVQNYIFQCLQDNNPVIPEDKYIYKASFATEDSLVKTIEMKIEDGLLVFNSKQILDLPAGTYRLELWEIVDDVIHAIYPSDRNLEFRVLSNPLDLPTGKVSSLTLDEFKKEFKRLIKTSSGGTGADVSIDVNKRIITVNDESLTIPAEIDLSKFASKEDLVGLVKQADLVEYAKKNEIPSTPDLTPYAKLSDLNKYATNESVDDKLSQPVKPTHPPMNYWLDRTTNPWTIWFDNGCGLQFPNYGTAGSIYGYGFSANEQNTNLVPYPLSGVVMSASHGSLTLDVISKKTNSFEYWASDTKVINPIRTDADGYDWSNVYFNDESRAKKGQNYTDRQRVMLRVMYELGIFSVEDLKPFGLVKK